jgi:hypothetical protein
MNRVRFCRLVCVLALTLLSVLPPATMAQAGPAETVSGVFAGFWSWMTGLWAEGGCHIDPNGVCAPEAPAPSDDIDGGCHIDPHGGCAPEAPPASQTDNGCWIDPNGGCLD